jgi:hypothetical protein
MTSIPIVLAALETLGGTVLTAPDTQIINGSFSSVTTTTGRVFVIGGDPELPIIGTRVLDSMSGRTTREDYVVPLVTSASLPGTDQTLADLQAISDYQAIELAVREYAGGALGLGAQGVMNVLPTGEFSLSRFATENGRSSAVRFSVRVQAQNT